MWTWTRRAAWVFAVLLVASVGAAQTAIEGAREIPRKPAASRVTASRPAASTAKHLPQETRLPPKPESAIVLNTPRPGPALAASSKPRRTPPASSASAIPPTASEESDASGDTPNEAPAVGVVGGIEGPAEVAFDESGETRALRERLLVRQLERELSKIDETQRELWYYNVMGRGMFVVVHVVLLLALYVAWVEFKNARGSREEAHEAAEQELKISLEGIALKSSLQGTILLGLAFGFYLLYVKFVYPLVVL